MKINSIQQQNNQKFKGNPLTWATNKIAQNPSAALWLAGSSVVAQKIVMSGSEAVIGPAMDVGIGKAITKATNETDGRTNDSSRVQAIRTFSQSVGGTIVGVIIRVVCITAVTKLFMKNGAKVGGKIAEIVNENNLSKSADAFLYKENMEKWGKSVGGALATIVMLGTNFIIDAPFINWINKNATNFVDNIRNKKAQVKEAKNG